MTQKQARRYLTARGCNAKLPRLGQTLHVTPCAFELALGFTAFAITNLGNGHYFLTIKS